MKFIQARYKKTLKQNSMSRMKSHKQQYMIARVPLATISWKTQQQYIIDTIFYVIRKHQEERSRIHLYQDYDHFTDIFSKALKYEGKI